MVETCPSCEKQFANRRSLASHKSRFHNKLKDSTSSSGKHLAGTIKNPDETSDIDSELSHGRESALNATIPSYSSGHPKVKDMDKEHDMDENIESESKASDVTSSSSDDDIQTDDSISNFDIASDISTSSNRSSTSVPEKYQLTGGKRKADDNSSKVVSLLTSIESALRKQSCKEEGLECFDFLFCYTMKKQFFSELDSWISTELGKSIEDVLTQDEQYFVDAIIGTTNLSNLHRLMNENSATVKSVLEQFAAEKKEKQRKRRI
ncbi:hypothetical protein ACHWQZ_G016864 [Mnemiopsis leidyi]